MSPAVAPCRAWGFAFEVLGLCAVGFLVHMNWACVGASLFVSFGSNKYMDINVYMYSTACDQRHRKGAHVQTSSCESFQVSFWAAAMSRSKPRDVWGPMLG